MDHTTDIVCPDENQCAYRPTGYICGNPKYGSSVGSLVQTFESHGRANLIFKNCKAHGFVQVFLNDLPIKAIASLDEVEYLESDDYYEDDMGRSIGPMKMEANFVVKPRDVLTLKEEDGAGIKIFSLTIRRGKKFL